MPRPRGLRSQPLDDPTTFSVIIEAIANTIVQPAGPALPELEHHRAQQPSAPIRRARDLLDVRKRLLELGHTILERRAVGKNLRLRRRPRPDLRRPRPRGEVRIALRFG